MKFKVIGAHKETGEDVEMVIMAITHTEAEHIATGKGIMVASVKAVEEQLATFEPIPLEPESISTTVGSSGPPKPTVDEPIPHTSHDTHTAVALEPASPATAAAGDGHAHAAAHAEPAHHETAHPDAHMEYKLLQNQALYLLEKSVNRFLADGWEPTGGLTIAVQNNAPNYFQALIRRRK